MLDKNDIEKFNLPKEFFEKIDKEFDSKFGDFIAVRTEFINKMSKVAEDGVKKISDKFWSEHEVKLLEHGTSKDQVVDFSKAVIKKILLITIDETIDPICS